MIIENDSLLVYENEKYVVLNTIEDNKEIYGIASKLDKNDNPVIGELRIFKNNSSGNLEMIINQELINKLLPIFQENLNKMISDYVNENNNI